VLSRPLFATASGARLATVPSLGAAATATAVASAASAQLGWAATPPKVRGAVLRRWHDLLLLHSEDLARILTAEQGKPLSEARGEIHYSADYLLWFSEESSRAIGDSLPSVAPGHRGFTIKQPVGVCGAITPWNFPTAMLARKCAAALAAGCAMVAKPSELTPFSALAFAELGRRAGLPAGCLSVITGEAAEIGAALTSSPTVRKISFTGSTRVGKLLQAACAQSMKRTSMELGGNAPFLIFQDADVQAAAAGAMASKFRNAGQTCISSNRFYVHTDVYDAFAAALAAAMDQLVVGPGDAPGVTLGPLINAQAVAKSARHVADCLSRGARLLRGGGSAGNHPLGPNFYAPTLLVDVHPDSVLCREETFGPVAALVRVSGEDEMLALANDSPFGLAAYVYTRDAQRLWRVAERLQAGMIGMNSGVASGAVAAPFGGVKESGHGREGSRQGMDEYLETKYLSMAV